jgi:transposase
LNTLDGTVLSQCRSRHTHQDWIAFLKQIDHNTPPDKALHVIADIYSAHKHPNVQRWLNRHPRFHMHFTPTSASWLNVVERFFRDLSQQRLRRGTFHNVDELIAAIQLRNISTVITNIPNRSFGQPRHLIFWKKCPALNGAWISCNLNDALH